MADGSTIEWTDATWNPVRGCTRVSPGCGGPGPHGGCYAEKIAARFSDPGQTFHGFAERNANGGRWTGKLALIEDKLAEPLHWRRPRRIFVNSMSDLFHENLPDEAIDRVFAVMALAPQHTFQVLTKRAKRMREYFEGRRANFGRASDVLQELSHSLSEAAHESACNRLDLFDSAGIAQRNIWLGVSAEDQQRADERVPELLATPSAVRFVSAEPLLGPVDFTAIKGFYTAPSGWYVDRDTCRERMDTLRGSDRREHLRRDGTWNHRRIDDPDGDPCFTGNVHPHLDWIIVGGESGQRARPMHPAWARSIRDQCATAGVPFFFKQWGVWGPDDGPPAQGRDRIFTGQAQCAAWDNSAWRFADGGFDPGLDASSPLEWVYRLGKKATGHLLDGVEHHAFPEPVEGQPA